MPQSTITRHGLTKSNFADIDETLVRELELRDDGQREERERHERVIHGAGERVRGLVRAALLGIHVGHRRVRHQSGDRQRDLGEGLRAVRHDDAASDRGDAAHGRLHRGVVRAHDDDVVRIVGDGRRDRAALQAEAPGERDADVARAAVPLDDRELQEVARGVRRGRAVQRAARAPSTRPSRASPRALR